MIIAIMLLQIVAALASTNSDKTSFTAIYEADQRFSPYLNSDWGLVMAADMNEVIADFFNDLSTTIFDLYKLDINLSLLRKEHSVKFEYKPETPTYRLKQNSDLLLYPTPTTGGLSLTLQRRSGDCSGLRLVQKLKDTWASFEGSDIKMGRTEDLVALKIGGIMNPIRQGYLRVPSGCLLYLMSVQRRGESLSKR